MNNSSELVTVCKAINYAELPDTDPLDVIPCIGFYEQNDNASCAIVDLYHCIDTNSSCLSKFAN